MIRAEADWNLILNVDTDKNIEVLVDRFKMDFPPKDLIRIVIIQEPTMYFISDVMKHPRCYTYVFTYHDDILNNNPKAVYFNGLTTWVDPNATRVKKFGVSTCVGGKTGDHFPGYAKRHELWNRRGEITIPRYFYLSSHSILKGADYDNSLILGDYKEVMFDCKYHIAIENNHMRNSFSEKILDCFLSYTIPIYIGAPNIEDFFDKRGFYSCNSIDEAIEIANSLKDDDSYDKKMDIMEDNFHRALEYSNYTVSLNKLITKLVCR